MSLRWRKNNQLLCAAKCEPEEGDSYIDDKLHYQLSVIEKVVIPYTDEHKTGRWRWKTFDPDTHNP